MKKLQLIMFAFCITLISCENDGPDHYNRISGFVTETNTGTPITNETVLLNKEYDVGQHVDKIRMETSTDNNGQYTIEIREGTVGLIEYNMWLDDDVKFYGTGFAEVKSNVIIDSTNITRNFTATPSASVILKVRNVTPFATDDKITIHNGYQ